MYLVLLWNSHPHIRDPPWFHAVFPKCWSTSWYNRLSCVCWTCMAVLKSEAALCWAALRCHQVPPCERWPQPGCSEMWAMLEGRAQLRRSPVHVWGAPAAWGVTQSAFAFSSSTSSHLPFQLRLSVFSSRDWLTGKLVEFFCPATFFYPMFLCFSHWARAANKQINKNKQKQSWSGFILHLNERRGNLKPFCL